MVYWCLYNISFWIFLSFDDIDEKELFLCSLQAHYPIELNRIFEFIKCFYVKKRNCDVCGHRLLQYLRGRSRGRESLPLFLCDLILLYCYLGTYGLEYTHPILNNTSLLFDQKVDLLFLPE